MEDISFFAQAFRWPPDETLSVRWSHRKKIKQAYKDYINNQKKDK